MAPDALGSPKGAVLANYTTEDLQALSDCEHVRKRPGMYIGDTNVRGVHQVLMELVDNVADQFLAGNASELDMQIDERLIVAIDDGPGLPFDASHDESESLATHYFTAMHHTPTADKHIPHVHFNGWGLGLFVVNALADYVNVRSWRNGQRFEQSFSRGLAEHPVRVIETGIDRGTFILLEPDREIFSDVIADPSVIAPRFKTISHLMPGLRLTLNGETFHSPGGLADWVVELAGNRSTREPFSIDCCIDEYRFQVAAAGDAVRQPMWTTFVNGNEMTEGGDHLDALRGLFSQAGWRPAVAMLNVTMMSPQFVGPTRRKLLRPEIKRPMCSVIRPALAHYCRELGFCPNPGSTIGGAVMRSQIQDLLTPSESTPQPGCQRDA